MFSFIPGLYTTFFVFPVKLIIIPLCKMGKVCSTHEEDLGSKTCKEGGGLETYECLGEGGCLNWTKLAQEVQDDFRLWTGGMLLVSTWDRNFF